MKVKNIYKIFSISVIFVALIISIIAMSTYSLGEELEDSFTGALLIEDKDAIPFVEFTKGVDISSFPSSKTLTKPNYRSQTTGACWAYSAMNALESTLLNKYSTTYNLSNSNNIVNVSHERFYLAKAFSGSNANEYGFMTLGKGGYALHSILYLTGGYGPIALNSNSPFNGEYTSDTLVSRNNVLNQKKIYDVTEIQVIGGVDPDSDSAVSNKINAIKDLINSGIGVTTNSRSLRSGCSCFNTDTRASYCPDLNGSYGSNCNYHASLIVGWNDNYSKDNFVEGYKPNKNGAWIIRNTHGSSGEYYISYYDPYLLNNENMAITSIKSVGYDHIYQYNPSGCKSYQYAGDYYCYSLGNVPSKQVVSIFEKNGEGNQKLDSVGFYVQSSSSKSVEVYFSSSSSNDIPSDLFDSNNKICEKNNITNNGYYSCELSNSKIISQQYFFIGLKGNGQIFAFQGNSHPTLSNDKVGISVRKNYYLNNSTWTDAAISNSSTIFVKAFTTDTNDEPSIIGVDSVTISPNVLNLKVGESSSLTYNISPSNADIKSTEWSSSNTGVVSVDKDGKVSAVGIGTANVVIKVVGQDNSEASDSIVVNVISQYTSVNSVTLVDTNNNTLSNSMNLNIGEEVTIKFLINPSNVTLKETNWTNSDSSKVSMKDSVGYALIKGIEVGSSDIEITVKDYDGNVKTDSVKVNVINSNQPVLVSSIALSPTSVTLNPNGTYKFNVTVSPSNATNKGVTWSSSNTNVVSVDQNGNIKALKDGTAKIRVTAQDGSGKYAEASVTVESSKPTNILVTGVSLNASTVKMYVGQSYQLIHTIKPSNATNKGVTWSSSNTNVVSVSNGKIVGKSSGKARITVTTNDGRYSAYTDVTVINRPSSNSSSSSKPSSSSSSGSSISSSIDIIKDTIELNKGSEGKLEYKLSQDLTDSIIIWKSSNTDVAVVKNGIVTAISDGEATITATINGKDIKDTCKIIVKKLDLTGIVFEDESLSISVGKTLKLTLNALPSGADLPSLKWDVDNKDILSVSDEGVIKAINVGETIVTVSSMDGKYSASINIIVTPYVSEPIEINVEGYDLNFDENTYSYTLKIKNEKSLKITSNVKDISIKGNDKLENGSLITITVFNDGGSKTYNIKIEKSKSYVYIFISIISLLLIINIIRIVLKKKKNNE
ncbi:MAG: Ig-like domain-containing protein [Clostridium sp.]|nr:Ig-like domain-containing protein [Clostridium sp.]